MRFFFVTSTIGLTALWGCDQGISGNSDYDGDDGIFVGNDGEFGLDERPDDESQSARPGMGMDAISGGFPFEGDLGDDDEMMAGPEPQPIFAMTNSAQGNEVVELKLSRRGVRPVRSYPTSGLGLGVVELPDLTVKDGIDPLLSESSLHQVGHHLLVVNAGSRSVSSFHVTPGGRLELIDVEQVNGHPTTITSQGGMVFVGVSPGTEGESGIVMMELDQDGSLDPIGRVLHLSGVDSHPSRVLVAGGGRFLVATEVVSDFINVWPLSQDGEPGRRMENLSEGIGPFGAAAFGEDYLLVTEAAPTLAGKGSISTYQIEDDGSLTPITSAMGTGQSATCWVQITPGGRYAFVTNTESGTISSFALGEDGTATLLDDVVHQPGGAPTDLSLDGTGRRLYVLLGGEGDIATYNVTASRQLELVGVSDTEAVPMYGAQGILAWRDLGQPGGDLIEDEDDGGLEDPSDM